VQFDAANRFEINPAQATCYTRKSAVHPWLAMNRRLGSLEKISEDGLDDGSSPIFSLITKAEGSTAAIIPQQNFCT
jgi:hypothetical protein